MCSLSNCLEVASYGEGAVVSWIKSPKCESSSSPTGVSKDVGSCETLIISRTFATSTSKTKATSSGVGSLPNSCINLLEILTNRLMVSTMCTGILIVLA